MINELHQFQMRRRAPMTSTERQALFRKRHPDYYRQYRLKRKERVAVAAAQLAAAHAAANAPKALPAPVQRLALPAPVEQLPILVPLARPERELVLVHAVPEQRQELKHLAD